LLFGSVERCRKETAMNARLFDSPWLAGVCVAAVPVVAMAAYMALLMVPVIVEAVVVSVVRSVY
jgi:hypothetical protein